MDYNSSRSLSSPFISIESTSLSTCTDNSLLHCTPLTNSSTPSLSPAIHLILPDGRSAYAGVELEAEAEGETGKLALARLFQRAFLAYIAPLEPLLLGLPANVLVLALMSRRSVRVTQRARFFYLLVAAADLVVHATYGLVLNVLMESLFAWSGGRLALPVSDFLCAITGLTYYAAAFLSNYTVLSFAIERFLAIYFPLRARSYGSTRHSVALVILCVVPVWLAFLPLSAVLFGAHADPDWSFLERSCTEDPRSPLLPLYTLLYELLFCLLHSSITSTCIVAIFYKVWKSRRLIRFARVTFSAAPTVVQLQIETYSPSQFQPRKSSLIAGLDSPEADPHASLASPQAAPPSPARNFLKPVNIGGSRSTLASASVSTSSSSHPRQHKLSGALQNILQSQSLRGSQTRTALRVLSRRIDSTTLVRRVEFRSTVACVAVGTLNSVFYNATGLLAIAHYALLPPSPSRGVLLRFCANGKLLAHSLNLFVYALIIPSFRTRLCRIFTYGLRNLRLTRCFRRRSSFTD